MSGLLVDQYQIKKLEKSHQKIDFSCGVVELDHYLKKQATQALRNRIAVTYVMTEEDASTVIGFYTLSSMTVALDSLPDELARKLPRYPLMPATLIGRLAVDKKYQKRGLGEVLLIDALETACRVSQKVASFAVVVDAMDKKAESFYKKYGFQQLTTGKHNKLFIPMKLVEKL